MIGERYSRKPSKQVEAVLRGDLPYEQADHAVRSIVGFQIYQAADEILNMSKVKRASAIAKLPEGLQPILKDEILRLHSRRKRQGKP